MGAKRGKYRQYDKNKYNKNYKSTGNGWELKAMNESTYETKISEAIRMAAKVHMERFKHYIDDEVPEVISLERFARYPQEKDTDVDGLVVGIYPHFLLVDCGNYKTTISYKDLVMKEMRGEL